MVNSLKSREIDIPKDGTTDPFLNCLLDRGKYASVLTNVVSNYSDGFVLAINNEWGTGKTTFLKMWKQSLKNEGFETIYFNAWNNDFQEEVIIALLSELRQFESQGREKFKKVLKNALPVLKGAGIELLKHAVGKATGDKAVELMIGAFGDYSLDSLHKNLEQYEEKKKGIEAFRSSLKEYLEEIDNDKPLIFFIDELDRCRPDYSVKVLEKIKHLFNVDGIVFVLSIDKDQLGHAICGAYGSENIDSNEYLRRFIDLEYSIPKPDNKRYINFLVENYGLKDFFGNRKGIHGYQYDLDNTILFLESIQNSLNISLRKMEKILGHISVSLKSIDKRSIILPISLIFMVTLKLLDNNFYRKMKSKTASLQELNDFFEDLFLEGWPQDKYHILSFFESELLYNYWQYLPKSNNENFFEKTEDSNDSITLKINSELNKSLDPNNLSANINAITRDYSREERFYHLNIIIESIDLTKRFLL